ncbi:MAG: tetratricopeptide repeat protein [Deltaproteobacteria bacterium]|nr:tetratricopeptide repeat protein [Deltaproteobacteria bacterium]MBW2020394.1 tetratricopeptide repeat protein [Deltaproteobacteria bacterium]MBW2074676.1 tetratricopeptide repeat protein [Deltaproteobacteria bacterium]
MMMSERIMIRQPRPCILMCFFLPFFFIMGPVFSVAGDEIPLHERSRSLLEKGEYDEAIETLKKLIELHPDHADAHNDLGLAYIKTGKFHDAVKEWKDAIAINPSLFIARYNLVLAYIEKKMNEEAISELKAILEIDPSQSRAHHTLGIMYFIVGNMELAEQAFKEAIRLDPSRSKHHQSIGILYADTEREELAEQALKQAIQLDPQNELAHLNLAHLYLRCAIDQYGKVLELNPTMAEIDHEYRRALKVNNNDAKAHFLLGLIHREEKKDKEAMAEFKKAAALDPSYGARIFYDRGLSLQNKEKYKEAVKEYETALALDPDHPESCYQLGVAYYLLGMYPKALSAMQKSVGGTADQSLVHLYMGMIYEKLGKEEAAIPEFEKSIQIKDNVESHWHLGQIYEQQGHYLEAVLEFQSVIDLNPAWKEKVAPHLEQANSLLAKKGEPLTAGSKARAPVSDKLAKEIEIFVHLWKDAWERQDFKRYVSHYHSEFAPRNMNRAQWLRYKKALFKDHKIKKIEVQDIKISEYKGRIIVYFLQKYASDNHTDIGTKYLYLKEEEGQWKIIREDWFPVREA